MIFNGQASHNDEIKLWRSSLLLIPNQVRLTLAYHVLGSWRFMSTLPSKSLGMTENQFIAKMQLRHGS